MDKISVIIPVYNEADIIAATIARLQACDTGGHITEVIVVDGGSTDRTMEIAQQAGAIALQSDKGRAKQMNTGARAAKGNLLYFLHADTLPPIGFTTAIIQAVRSGFSMGCLRLSFDVKHWFMSANAWFTRFNVNAFRFGDQSLFVQKNIFEKSGGFNEKNIILEDQEIMPRLQQHGRFIVLPMAVVTSGRKYITNGVYKTQAVYFLVYLLYKLGVPQRRLLQLYRRLIKQDKL